MDKSIFISYSWKDVKKINYIDSFFSRFQIYLTRDVRDLEYTANIHEFMNSIKTHDKLIIYVSENYLESTNCMYEASQILDSKEKVVFIIKKEFDIFDIQTKDKYIKFWDSKLEVIQKKDSKLFRQEILDTQVASNSIAKFIDLIKECKCMFDENLDFNVLFNILEVEKKFPNIIDKTVYNWIANNSINKYLTIINLVADLKKSNYIEISDYPNIPDDETRYIFHDVLFEGDKNGVNLKIICANEKAGEMIPFNYPHLWYIEENTNRSQNHSKYYFYCENLSKKQHCNYLKNIKRYRELTSDEDRELRDGYKDTYRIIIHF